MRPRERRKEILALLDRIRVATVEELAEQLYVSRETIRRDLLTLDAEGCLHKYHGGARALDHPNEPQESESPFAMRMAQNNEGKRAIAEAASRYFETGDTIFIDTGTTTLAMASALARIPGLLVITNSPRIAAAVAENGSNKVFLIGGAFAAEVGENVGPLALEQIGKFRAKHAILTIGAMDRACIMNFDLQEAEIARAMIERSDRVTVVADHTKFDRRAVFEVAQLTRIERVITDVKPSPAMCDALSKAGVELVIADGTDS